MKRISTLFFTLITIVVSAQFTTNEQVYNGFTSRSFMKFNRFLIVPTFSVVYDQSSSVAALVRSANIEFEDSPRLSLISHSGRVNDKIGFGVAVYQQEVGVFSDFGAVINYAQLLELNNSMQLAFGFNLAYSRRGADNLKVLSESSDPTLQNFQGIPVATFQPAVTLSFKGFNVGVFVENLIDYNLKQAKMVTEFSQKVISAHAGYTFSLINMGGLLQGSYLRVLGIAKKQPEGFGYGANAIFDLPKVGWLKGAYDKDYGFQVGVGVNLSKKIAIGFSFEKNDFATTNEVGFVYNFISDKKRGEPVIIKNDRAKPDLKPQPATNKTLEKKDSEAMKKAQDSINSLNRKVEQVLRLLKERPKQIIIRDTVRIKTVEREQKDTSLRRSTATPWREKYITVEGSSGEGGTAYYVALNQFKDLAKVKDKMSRYKKRGVTTKYVQDSKSKLYYIYLEKFSRAKDADRVRKEINGGGAKRFENNKANDLGIKIKKVSKDPVYVQKITTGGGSQSYKEMKKQALARIYPLQAEGVEPAYYLRVSVNGKKEYADKRIDELRADNINADFYIDPATGYRHVYIYKTTSKEEAIRMYNTNLNGAYYDKKSIIKVN